MTTPNSGDRRAALDRAARLRQLPLIDQDIIRLANEPGFGRWLEQVRAIGGCAHPVHLSGHTTTYDPATGEILHSYTTRDEPGERLLVRCRNRRRSVCPSCSHLHAGDTYHLVRAGLTGGKTVPDTVREHPRLFVTLTAPSFGPVHRTTTDGTRCHPRRGADRCEHGRPLGCPAVHSTDDALVGQPLCPACYDYTAHILWHAHAGELWNRFTRNIRRHLATTAGIPQTHFPRHARLSFTKVAEYQRRAAVHLHAVIRLDGPTGPGEPPPTWATPTLLIDAVRAAAHRAAARTPHSPAISERTLQWGTQLDAHPIDADGLDDEAVAAYVAKYVTKSATEASAGTDRRIRTRAEIDCIPTTPHARALMRTCWQLGTLPELRHLRLRTWTHTLGYRGHILTKSRAYSTTYAALRGARAGYRGAAVSSGEERTIRESRWRYLGAGHSPGSALIAGTVAHALLLNRAVAQDALRADGSPG
ncbi:replication initiator [Streptomyces thioluteus]|uniref:replication initiator n=1 Tax=Streptomyces thioluteus TaxID=66431 RepID=UPI0031EBC1DA